mgnify:CR=1 FL=1
MNAALEPTTTLTVVEVGGFYEFGRWQHAPGSSTSLDGTLGFRYWNIGSVSRADAADLSAALPLIAVGLAKKEELLFQRGIAEPVALAHDDPALHLVQRIRDEAHRFAVSFHRVARRQRDLRSELDDVPGVGPRRRRALLRTFGSVAGVRRATREELEVVVGPKVASAILQYFAVAQ